MFVYGTSAEVVETRFDKIWHISITVIVLCETILFESHEFRSSAK